MKIHFKRMLNGLGVDKYRVSDILQVDIHDALDLILYEDRCHALNVADLRTIQKTLHLDVQQFVEDKREHAMKWREIKELLDTNSTRVSATLSRWKWAGLKRSKIQDYPLMFVEQLCDELNINIRKLLFY